MFAESVAVISALGRLRLGFIILPHKLFEDAISNA